MTTSQAQGGTVISLSHGSVLDATPAEALDAAAAAGYDACSLRLDPHEVGVAQAHRLRARADDLGLATLDVEVVRLGRDQVDDQARLIDLAAILGASYVLTVSHQESAAQTTDTLGALERLAGASEVAVALEFMSFTSVRTLGEAVEIAEAAGVAVVVDALHLHRSGGRPEDLRTVPPDRIAYVQFCDAPAEASLGPSLLTHEARHARLAPGAGALPLAALVEVAPYGVPWALEVQSDDLAARLPPPARARHLRDRAHAYLGGIRPLGTASR